MIEVMEYVWEATWRVYPSLLMALAALPFIRGGLRHYVRARALPGRDAAKPAAFLQGFRLVVIGVSLAAFAAAWTWQIPWLAILTLIIFGEEVFESTMAISGILDGAKLRA